MNRRVVVERLSKIRDIWSELGAAQREQLELQDT